MGKNSKDIDNLTTNEETNDVAPASTGSVVSHIWGKGGNNYASLITAEALNQARSLLKSPKESIVERSVQDYNKTVDEPNKHRIPRPDDILRNQMAMQELQLVKKLKDELEAELGYKLELKPGQKLTVPSLKMQIEEVKLKNKKDLEYQLQNAQKPEPPK